MGSSKIEATRSSFVERQGLNEVGVSSSRNAVASLPPLF